jgi:hypothetical protein
MFRFEARDGILAAGIRGRWVVTTPTALLGTWRMVSWVREVVATGERADVLGADPVGYIAYHADGRVMALVVRNERAAPKGSVPTAEEKLALFDSMIAYAGHYTLDDEKVVHHVDASWNQSWTGTDVVRFYDLDGDRLTLRGAPAVDPYTGEEVVYLIEFRRPPGSS